MLPSEGKWKKFSVSSGLKRERKKLFGDSQTEIFISVAVYLTVELQWVEIAEI